MKSPSQNKDKIMKEYDSIKKVRDTIYKNFDIMTTSMRITDKIISNCNERISKYKRDYDECRIQQGKIEIIAYLGVAIGIMNTIVILLS